jgi:hypothetical protein
MEEKIENIRQNLNVAWDRKKSYDDKCITHMEFKVVSMCF